MKKLLPPGKLLLAGVLVGIGGSADAHHAAAPHFNLNETVTVEGVITGLKLVNPHGYIYFDVTDDSGTIVNWRCALTSVSRMKNLGWTAETLKLGQTVSITGSPARREENHCFFRSLEIAGGISIDRGKNIAGKLTPGDDPGTSDAGQAKEDSSTPFQRYLADGQPNLRGPWHTPAPAVSRIDLALSGMGMAAGAGRGAAGIPEPTDAGLHAASGYDRLYDDPALFCHPGNIISAWRGDDNVNDIYQEEDKITLVYGYMDLVRTIYMDQSEHPDEIDPSVGGHSIGWWEDDALVVHTAGFEQGVLFRDDGRMYSQHMEVVERFEVSEDGQTLSRAYTAHDPAFLQSDWVGETILQRTNSPMIPYDCISLEGANNQRPSN